MEETLLKHCKDTLKKNNLHPLKKLGKGAFSFVFSAEKIELKSPENEVYSVKCINKKQFAKKPYLVKYIEQEIQSMRDVSHNNIVRLSRTFEGIPCFIQTKVGSSLSWSFVIKAISTLTRPLAITGSLTSTNALTFWRVCWLDCPTSTQKISFTEILKLRTFSCYQIQPKLNHMAIQSRSAIWGFVEKMIKTSIPSVELLHTWPLRSLEKRFMTIKLMYGP